MNFCPKCGTRLEPNARFCQECGFDSNSVIARNEIKPELETAHSTIETSPLQALNPVVLPKTPEPTRFSSQPNAQPARASELPIQMKRKMLWFWIVLILGILGAAGWFGYKSYFGSYKNTPVDIASNIIISENSKNEKSESNTKAKSLMDQELAKQKAIGQNQSAPQEATNQNDESIKVSEKEIASKVILEVGRKEAPKNKNPKNPTKLKLQNPTIITRIITDHYNAGMGTPRGGIITIKDSDGNIKGSFKAFGKTGKNGTPSAKWVAEPNIKLEKGTYFISDSDMVTWSKTFPGNNGFIVVEGYETE